MKKFDKWRRGEIGIAKCLSCGEKTMIVRKAFTGTMYFRCGCGLLHRGTYGIADMKSMKREWGRGE